MKLINADCIEAMKAMPDNSVDSIVTDPPYELGFMGKSWDSTGIAFNVEVWQEALRVLKPGGHLIAFSGSRTYHRMAVAIEDAGFQIRDQIMWIYGSGFPKSHDVSKGIDKRGGVNVSWFGPWFREWREKNNITQKEVAALFPSKTGNLTGCVANWELGFNLPTPEQFNLIRDTYKLPFVDLIEAEREVVGQSRWDNSANHFIPGEDHKNRVQLDITAPATDAAKQWQGWGTALKPAHEPMVLARKPLIGTVAANVLEWGVGGLNIDGSRVGSEDIKTTNGSTNAIYGDLSGNAGEDWQSHSQGRWPANFIHDGSDEVVELFPSNAKPKPARTGKVGGQNGLYENGHSPEFVSTWVADEGGSAARFFYCAKTSKRDRNEGLDGFEEKTWKDQGFRDNESTHLSPRAGAGRTSASANHHPTVKPTDLMRYLCKLITPPNGTVLDPFMGSGSTGKGAVIEGFDFIGIEMNPEYLEIAKARIEFAFANKSNELPL